MPKPLIALKPYLDQIRQACEKYSHDDLLAAILKLAAAQPPGAREAFLVQIRTILKRSFVLARRYSMKSQRTRTLAGCCSRPTFLDTGKTRWHGPANNWRNPEGPPRCG